MVGSTSGPAVDASGETGSSASTATGAARADALASALTLVDLRAITFAPGTSDLTPSGSDAVQRLAGALLEHPSVPVAVEVTTDTQPTTEENRDLSARQADAVGAALTAAGVEPDRLVTIGLGRSPGAAGQDVVRFASEDPAVEPALDALDPSPIVLDESLRLSAGSAPVLDEVAALLLASPGARLHIFGHAFLDDEEASHDRSHTLGDRVSEYLVAAGVDADRIDTTGLGDTPVPTERRVDVTVEVGSRAALAQYLHAVDTSRIRFEPGTTTLTSDGRAAVTEVAAALVLDDGQRIEITAHAFTEDGTAASRNLSHRQGEAVIDALAELGVDRGRLELIALDGASGLPHDRSTSAISFAPLD